MFKPSLTLAGGGKRAWFIVHERGLLLRREGERMLLPTDEDARALKLDTAETHPLGELDGADAVAVHFGGALESIPAGFEALGLRGLAASLNADLFLAAGRALHVIDWATTSRFCGRCGTRTVRDAKLRIMSCPACKLEFFPRIAPAVIVLIRRGEQALLARNARFPGAFFSTLAGFSEIGESLEQTLAREVFEEVGIQVKDLRYFGSQPWPFPHSLMVGFTAEWAGGEIVVDNSEIAEARWYFVDALPQLPPSLSIARQLIDAWVDSVRGLRPLRSAE
jgi:NAD+ diphosphatase